jgi:hypothetical protein
MHYDGSMIVALGGIAGSGRRFLASELARRYMVYNYDMRDKKMHVFSTRRRAKMTVLQPRSDQERIWLYDRALSELPLLCKLHKDILVQEGFNFLVPRRHFLNEARKYAETVFIWVESDDVFAKELLEAAEKRGEIRSAAAAMKKRHAQRDVSQLEDDVIKFIHKRSQQNPAEELWQLIRTSINGN